MIDNIEKIAKLYNFNPKWALSKDELNKVIQQESFGNE